MTSSRIEQDSLGTKTVAGSALFGVQTVRAIENFPISGLAVGQWPEFVRAFALVKKSCALSNLRCGLLRPEICTAIIDACDLLVSGKYLDQFPIDMLQGGAGTSTNMNVNEVIANVALETIGLPPGRYDVIHPNDHVNMSQSTNDVYPTAARLACMLLHANLNLELALLARSFSNKADAFSSIAKLGRTQLQDAVPMTLGQEFSAFATVIDEDVDQGARIALNFLDVGLGGTAIGTGLNAPVGYKETAISKLSELSGLPFKPAVNMLGATWDLGAFVLYSGMLKRTATKLSKIANDLRLLSSGPRGGLGEIHLPDRQPGSSIMPGKINPVIPEVVSQIAFAVIGNDVTITLAAEAGQLQLNAMAPVLVQKVFESTFWLTNGARIFRTFCVDGIEADESVSKRHLNAGTARVAELVPILGYEAATEIAKSILHDGLTLAEAVERHARTRVAAH